MSTYTNEVIDEARRQLTVAVQQLAKDTVRATGIDYTPSPDAPETWGALQAEYARAEALSHKSTYMFPVYDGASDQTIYTSAEANYAFRYWHDMGHVQYGMSFTPEDETELQNAHHLQAMWDALSVVNHGSRVVDRAGMLAYEMYYADTVGQIEYVVARGHFPTNQLAFVLAYVDNSQLALDTDY